jgi:hypothetical protein
MLLVGLLDGCNPFHNLLLLSSGLHERFAGLFRTLNISVSSTKSTTKDLHFDDDVFIMAPCLDPLIVCISVATGPSRQQARKGSTTTKSYWYAGILPL